ncbi:MAG: 2Fe-2S ferredoxin [Gammaproteobacteria bacterium]|nr:2Fe-2S ferredoxin [Gammaproteobacteria bacterium]
MKLYYEKHIFFCTNLREDKNKVSCGAFNSAELRIYMKKKVKESGIKGVRINASGCLNRCKLGPILVAYPKGVWFKVKNKKDIDLLIEQFLYKDKIVNKLLV